MSDVANSASPANGAGQRSANNQRKENDFQFGVTPRWSIPLIGSLLAMLICGWVVAAGLFPIAITLMTSQNQSETNSAINKAIEKHDSLAKVSADRFTGRSLFTMPSPPPRPAPAPAAPVAPPPPPPPAPPPSAPSEYTGTKPTGMLGQMIFFGSELTIRVGEEKNGIKIIAVEPPTNVRIGHMGGIYSVAVWAPTDMSKLNTAGNSSSSAMKFTTVRVPNANEKSAASEQAQGITQGITQGLTQGTIPASPIAPIAPAIPAQSSVDTNDEPNPDAPDAQREAPRSARPSSARSAAGGNASNQPQLPPPAATATPESPLLPITPEQISAMSQGDVASALARVARARQSQGLDQATQDRLRSEFGLLRERQSSFYR